MSTRTANFIILMLVVYCLCGAATAIAGALDGSPLGLFGGSCIVLAALYAADHNVKRCAPRGGADS